MVEFIKKFIKQTVNETINENIGGISLRIESELIHGLWANIGLREFREIIDYFEKNGVDYVSIADVYSYHVRKNLEKENGDILHKYFELLPKLADFKEVFNKKFNRWI